MIAVSAAILPGQMNVPVLAVLLGSCLLVWGFLQFSTRGPKQALTSTIKNVPRGQVKIHGTVTGPYSITAPITGKDCYLYRTTVWQQKKSPTHAWEKLTEETLHVPFFLEDSTGQLLIEPLGAELEIPISLREEYGGSVFVDPNAMPPAVSALLARHRITPANRVLIEEFCVEAQSDLFATGTVTENPGVELRPFCPKKPSASVPAATKKGQLQSAVPEIIRLSDTSAPLPSGAMSQQSRIAAALTKAGIQNPNAWAAAGVPYPGAASASATAVLPEEDGASLEKEEICAGFNLKPHLVLMKGAGDAPFVLSTRSTCPPDRPSNWRSAVLLTFGAALIIVGLWALLANGRFL